MECWNQFKNDARTLYALKLKATHNNAYAHTLRIGEFCENYGNATRNKPKKKKAKNKSINRETETEKMKKLATKHYAENSPAMDHSEHAFKSHLFFDI